MSDVAMTEVNTDKVKTFKAELDEYKRFLAEINTLVTRLDNLVMHHTNTMNNEWKVMLKTNANDYTVLLNERSLEEVRTIVLNDFTKRIASVIHSLDTRIRKEADERSQ